MKGPGFDSHLEQPLFSMSEKLLFFPTVQWVPFFPSAYLLQHPPTTTTTMSLIVNCRSNLFLIHIHYTSEAGFLLAASLLSPSPFLSPLFLGLFPSTGIIMMCRQQNRWMLYCPKKKIHLLISPLKADLWASITVFENPQTLNFHAKIVASHIDFCPQKFKCSLI